jgi:hypothetical protein
MRYAERNDVQRWLFLRVIALLCHRHVYYLDECGVDHRLHPQWARAPRGTPVYTDVPGGKRGRTSIISTCRNGRLVQPWLFEGPCNTAVVNTYLAKMLLPFIPLGSVIVLDNARFHCAASTRALVEAAGCELLFLPAYSPDLNPIEHVWAALKNALRPKLWKMKRKAAYIAKTILNFCTTNGLMKS